MVSQSPFDIHQIRYTQHNGQHKICGIGNGIKYKQNIIRFVEDIARPKGDGDEWKEDQNREHIANHMECDIFSDYKPMEY